MIKSTHSSSPALECSTWWHNASVLQMVARVLLFGFYGTLAGC